MLLAIDIGNSSINSGIFAKSRLVGKMKLPSHPKKTSTYYKNRMREFLSKNNVEMPLTGVIISSVVPGLTGVISSAAKELSKGRPLVVSASLKTGLKMDVKNPNELGADRISNAVAAREIFGPLVLVVDFGTATTISAVKSRRFIGGAILPGLDLMGEVLGKKTAKLPSVDMKYGFNGRLPSMGKNTTACIMSGILYGTAGATERIIREMEREEKCKFKIVVTGGHAGTMSRFLNIKHCSDPDLTLKGLNLIYERNA